MEERQIWHDQGTSITYQRLNHKDFMYKMNIKNTRMVKRKVIVRLWLGILKEEHDIRSVKLENMLNDFNLILQHLHN